MNKGKRIGKLIMMSGVLFILAAFCLTLYNNHADSRAGKLSAEVISKLNEESTTTAEIFDEHTPPDYIVNPDMPLPAKTINGNKFVGTLAIPALKLKLPVMNGWSYDNLDISPCVYDGTPYKNNFIIAAHNYDEHFGYIHTLVPGDNVSFKDMDGNIFNYEVMYIEDIDSDDIEKMYAGDWDFSFFTCNYSWSKRVTVRCRIIRE